MKHLRILVTGHHGYIGTILSRMLMASGHTVVGADMYLYERCTFGDEHQFCTNVIRKDIRELTVQDMTGFDAVAHLAGLCNDPLGDLVPEATIDVNHQATVRLARIAKEAGVERFVFSSSCSVYGAATADWVHEESLPNPVTPYGVSKLEAENDLRQLADDVFSPVYLRSATAYGFSPRIRFDLVLNNLVAYALTKGEVLLKSDGKPWRPIVHIEDISRAFRAAIEAPRDTVHDQVFNVGITTENYQIREIAEIVEEVVPGARVCYSRDASPDKRSYRVDCSKISRLLPGFKPQWTALRGAEELYERYQAIGLTLEDFEGVRYQRLAHLKMLMARGLIDQSLRWVPNSINPADIHAAPLLSSNPLPPGTATV
jgi:nucleoside-diphosphate-sugar epimerase